jgi:hypothetical protein
VAANKEAMQHGLQYADPKVLQEQAQAERIRATSATTNNFDASTGRLAASCVAGACGDDPEVRCMLDQVRGHMVPLPLHFMEEAWA